MTETYYPYVTSRKQLPFKPGTWQVNWLTDDEHNYIIKNHSFIDVTELSSDDYAYGVAIVYANDEILLIEVI